MKVLLIIKVERRLINKMRAKMISNDTLYKVSSHNYI